MNTYFIGIGGIGMSAIARLANLRGDKVAGYDLTPSSITDNLQKQGIDIHFEDNVNLIPSIFKDPLSTLVIFTPAIPKDHAELNYFRSNGFRVIKRAEALGDLTSQMNTLAVAGTHGKTTTSTLLAHLLFQSHVGCNAILGGIAGNYKSNYLENKSSNLMVVEADEFDRSFHQLQPSLAIITSADPDHLDIYHTEEAYKESFEVFTSKIRSNGILILKKGVTIHPQLQEGVRLFSYSATDASADYYATKVEVVDGHLFFDFHHQTGYIAKIELGAPLLINVENAVGAIAAAMHYGAKEDEIRQALKSFKGPQRRFDIYRIDQQVVIDDYAHHPMEIKAAIASVRKLFAEKKIITFFQPHLYSRTADFYKEFAQELAQSDKLILLDLYPARELPMDNVSEKMIADEITNKNLMPKEDVICMHRDDVINWLKANPITPEVEIILFLGAGNIDRLVSKVTNFYQSEAK